MRSHEEKTDGASMAQRARRSKTDASGLNAPGLQTQIAAAAADCELAGHAVLQDKRARSAAAEAAFHTTWPTRLHQEAEPRALLNVLVAQAMHVPPSAQHPGAQAATSAPI